MLNVHERLRFRVTAAFMRLRWNSLRTLYQKGSPIAYQ